jgi:hypothetical protein
VLLAGVAIFAVEWGAPGSGGGMAEGQGGGCANGVRDGVMRTTAATTVVHPAAINLTKVLIHSVSNLACFGSPHLPTYEHAAIMHLFLVLHMKLSTMLGCSWKMTV